MSFPVFSNQGAASLVQNFLVQNFQLPARCPLPLYMGMGEERRLFLPLPRIMIRRLPPMSRRPFCLRSRRALGKREAIFVFGK